MIGIDYSSLELNNTDKYKLSSIITGDNLLFAITRLSDGKIIKIKELSRLKENFFLDSEYILKLFKNNNLLSDNFIEASIAFAANEVSIVPRVLLSKEIKNYNSLLQSVPQYLDDFEIQKSYIQNIDSYSFFPFPKALDNLLKSNYRKFSIHHSNDALICQAAKSITSKDFILANFHEYLLQTIVYREKKLVQSNIYSINTKEDILYYILLNLKNNAIPLNMADVFLSGRVYKESSIHKLLYEHIKNIYFVNDLNRLDFANVFLGKAKHLFFDIYSLAKCV